MAARRKPRYQTVEGLIVAEMLSPVCLREALRYKPRSDDLFVVTFPKCGTTWTQTILLNIFSKGQPLDINDVQRQTPYLEFIGVENMKRPGSIKTHLPFSLLPYSPDAKYIYVARNPKDCCVSFFYHTKGFDGYDFLDGTFDDFFELFINGEVEYGDYFNHILSWYEHRNDPNVLFLTYEDMKKDTPGVVLKMAKFIGEEYGDLLERDPTVMEKVLHQSSFEYMKEMFNLFAKNFLKDIPEEELDKLPIPKGMKYLIEFRKTLNLQDRSPETEFIRKGVVGDWRSHFSLEQSKRMDDRFKEVLGHTELAELWEEDIKF